MYATSVSLHVQPGAARTQPPGSVPANQPTRPTNALSPGPVCDVSPFQGGASGPDRLSRHSTNSPTTQACMLPPEAQPALMVHSTSFGTYGAARDSDSAFTLSPRPPADPSPPPTSLSPSQSCAASPPGEQDNDRCSSRDSGGDKVRGRGRERERDDDRAGAEVASPAGVRRRFRWCVHSSLLLLSLVGLAAQVCAASTCPSLHPWVSSPPPPPVGLYAWMCVPPDHGAVGCAG